MKNITRPFLVGLLSFLSIFSINAQNIKYQNRAVDPNLMPQSTQEQCGTDRIHQHLMNTDPSYKQQYDLRQSKIAQYTQNQSNNGNKSMATVYTVPVVFHIMHTGQAEGVGFNISDAQVQSAVTAMNEDFRKMAGTNGDGAGVDTEIEFCLAVRDPNGNPTNGINRINASGLSNYSNGGVDVNPGPGVADDEELKALSQWDNLSYMNVWVVNEIDNNNGGSGTQGYAYPPVGPSQYNVDGIIILYNAVGTVGPDLKSYTNMNRTLTHEAGHYLDLKHTFEGGSCSQSNCNTQGDLVCDTPPTQQGGSCGSPICAGQQVENYMDYTSQTCKDMYTAGQTTRMRATFVQGNSIRYNLLSSVGCTPAAVPVSDFYALGTSACTGVSVDFFDNSINGTTGWAWVFENNGTASTQNPSKTWSTGGIYDVSLTASNGVGTGNTETKTDYITVYNAPQSSCNVSTNNLGNFGSGIVRVQFSTIDNAHDADNNENTQDFKCAHVAELNTSTTYPFTITGADADNCKIYIDYNGDGTYALSELVYSGTGLVSHTGNITTPASVTYGSVLGMRVISDFWPIGTDPCGNLAYGEVEDYGVYFEAPPCVAPSVTSQPSNSTITENENTSFSISATGDGLTYRWQRNGVNLSNGGIYSGATTTTLTLTGVPLSQDGNTYRCVVTGTCGTENSNNATLTVNAACVAPSVTSQPSNSTITENENTSFSISATGDGLTYRWQRNGTNLSNSGIYSGVTTTTLTLTGVPLSQDGSTYRCVVTGTCGTENSNNATLTVNAACVAPSVTSQPSNSTITESENTSFSISATGDGLTYRWQRNGANLSNSGIYSGVTTTTLTLTGVPLSQDGSTYRCVVTGTCGTENSNNATLTVNAACVAPSVSGQPSNRTIVENNNTTFSVTATGDGLTYQWQENNANISNGGIYSGVTSSTLTLTSVPLSQDGNTYRCVVTGTCGNETSSNASLTVEAANITSFMQWTNDGTYGKQFSYNQPITATSVYVVPKKVVGATSYELEISNNNAFTGSVTLMKSGNGNKPVPSDFLFTNLPAGETFWTRVKVNGGSYGSVKKFFTHSIGVSSFKYSLDGQYGKQFWSANPITAKTTHIAPWYKSGVSSYTVQIDVNPSFNSNDTSWVKTANSAHYSNYQFKNLPASTEFYVRVMTDLDNNNWGIVKTFMTEGAAERPTARVANNTSIESEVVDYKVYPNPFADNINLRVDSKKQENLMVTISDLTGKVVYQSTRHQTNQTIQLGNDLVDGMYLIQLVHGDNIKLIKAIKK